MIVWKTAAFFSACVALSACSADSETFDEEGLEAIALSGVETSPGLYAIGDAGQTYAQTRINEDGTYVDMDTDGAPVGGGSWEVHSQMTCFDPEGDGPDQQEQCWTNGPAQEDGSFITTRDDGSKSYRVTPVDEGAED